MKTADRNGFLTTSLAVNVILAASLVWQWGTGRVVIPLRPVFATVLTLLPYGIALGVVYVGVIAWLYLLLALVGERWPRSRSLVSWLAPESISKRFMLVCVLMAVLMACLAVPYISSRAHLIRSIIAELGLAGQGLALAGTVASIYGFLALIIDGDGQANAKK